MTRDATSTVNFLRFMILISSITAITAGPRYLAIPIDGVDVIELNPISPSTSYASSRLPRHVETYIPVNHHHHHTNNNLNNIDPLLSEQTIQVQPAITSRSERATAHILDYVDFGAHTGPNGAFSWYADYPSHH